MLQANAIFVYKRVHYSLVHVHEKKLSQDMAGAWVSTVEYRLAAEEPGDVNQTFLRPYTDFLHKFSFVGHSR